MATLLSDRLTAIEAPIVLVVDDEPQIRELMALYLERAGYRTRSLGEGASVLDEIEENPVDLMVLDLMLPGVDGFTVLRELRASGSELPVIVLSARGHESERVTGLQLGADDYVVKPASPREMVARVDAVLRRTRSNNGTPAGTVINAGRFEIDLARREARIDGAAFGLPRKEFDLLAHLVAHPGLVFSRAALLNDVWGSNAEWQDPATVTVHVRRLRQKIETDPTNPAHLHTVYGIGYRFEA